MENIISNKNTNFIKLKKLLKSGNNSLVATDDISVLKLAETHEIKIESLYYSNEIKYHNDTLEIIEFLKDTAQNTFVISKKNVDSLKRKKNSAGVFAIIDISLKKLEDFKHLNFIIVCDSIEIPGNLGTIYRTCDSAKVDGMILVDTITKPNNPDLISSSRGCNLIVPTVSENYQNTLNYLINNGYSIYLGEPKLGKNYQEYDYNEKIAIVVGNERFGINSDWYNHKNKKVFIPMYGSNNSLNVSVAASILIYEASMKRNK